MIITLSGFCDAHGGGVVECEPKTFLTSEILKVMSFQIQSSQNRIWNDITLRISDVRKVFGSHSTTPPPCSSQNPERVISWMK